MKEEYKILKKYNINNENIETQYYAAMTSLFCIGDFIDSNTLNKDVKDAYLDAINLLNLEKYDSENNYKSVTQIASNFIIKYYSNMEDK